MPQHPACPSMLGVSWSGSTAWSTRFRWLGLPLLVGLLALLMPAATSAQDEDGVDTDVQGLVLDSIDVSIVNLEVYVTDKKGNRITGLKREDFELLANRKPIAITNFFEVEGGAATTDTGRPLVSDNLDPRLQADPRRRKVPEDQRLHLIVYVDNLNLRPFTRNRTIRYIRTFLRNRLRPGDEVMLATYERSLHIRHQFTSDPEIISSALYDVEEMSGMGVHADSERRDILRDIYEADSINLIRGRATQYAESMFSDMRFTLDALKELIDTLAGLPGRKAILYVSDGLPMRAGDDIFHAMYDRFTDSSDNVLMDGLRYDLSRQFQELTARANTHRVTFYTVDASGLRTYSYMDASNSSIGGGSKIDQVHFTNIQSSLRMMASETGGMVLLNTNNYEPLLNRVAEDFDTYYSLGFSPASTESGRYHRLKVKVKGRKGLVVRTRDGYRDKPVSTRMSEGTLAALHYGYQSNPLGIEIEIGEENTKSKDRFLVEVKVRIPIAKLSFLPQEDMQRGRLRLFISAKDAEGGLAPVQDVPVPIDIPQAEFERAQEQTYQYSMKLIMRGGRQVVAVGVRDEIGAVNGFATRGVRIGSIGRSR
ncbi:MAG: VWA domain-containing protein [Acidobacteriota bacterium]